MSKGQPLKDLEEATYIERYMYLVSMEDYREFEREKIEAIGQMLGGKEEN